MDRREPTNVANKFARVVPVILAGSMIFMSLSFFICNESAMGIQCLPAPPSLEKFPS